MRNLPINTLKNTQLTGKVKFAIFFYTYMYGYKVDFGKKTVLSVRWTYLIY